MYGIGEYAFFAALTAEGWSHARATFAQWRRRRRREREVAMLENWFGLSITIHSDSRTPQTDR